MKQKKEREKEISQWPWISMLPFGILAGYWGDKEVRITAISEYGFQILSSIPVFLENSNKKIHPRPEAVSPETSKSWMNFYFLPNM